MTNIGGNQGPTPSASERRRLGLVHKQRRHAPRRSGVVFGPSSFHGPALLAENDSRPLCAAGDDITELFLDRCLACLALLWVWLGWAAPAAAELTIVKLDPPEQEFFSKRLNYEGLPIKAHQDVADEALREAHQRLSMMLDKLPNVRRNLEQAHAELHIIGKNQVTSDLPEHRRLKGKPFDGQLTVDERTRGLGGRLTSCGEENLLRLPRDRYRGRDICVHEFAHNIFQHGVQSAVRERVRQQRETSLAAGLWQKSYAGSNADEFFAELAMWYFGTHGDTRMQGPPPGNGREGLKKYDPAAYALLDDFYQGRIEVPVLEKSSRRR